MNVWFLARAAHRRARLAADGSDSGFVMIYVLMIISIISVLVVSSLVVSASSVVPAIRSSFGQSAYAAAQGGLAAFVGYIDHNCADANSAVATCTLPTNVAEDVTIATGANNYRSSYSWYAVADAAKRYFRVRATGTVAQNGMTVSKTIIGDVAGGASNNLLDYGVVTGFETQSPDIVLFKNPGRTIAISSAALTAAGAVLKKAASGATGYKAVTWSGASPGTAAGKVATCNAQYSGKYGRSTNLPPGAPTPYVDWSESALNGDKYDNFQPCQVTFGHLTQLLAPDNPADGIGGYFTKDALLLSNSWPGGTGPLVNQPVTTQYQYTSADGPCGSVGMVYRAFNLVCVGYPVEVGGSPAPASKYGVSWVPQGTGPGLPTNAPPIPATACVYNGPTRVNLNGDGSAQISSPQTTLTWVSLNAASRPAQCYAGATSTGLSAATISLTTPTRITTVYAANDGKPPPTTPALAHGSSGWPVTGQRLGDPATTANSVFYMTSAPPGGTVTTYSATAADTGYTPAIADNPSSKSDGVWTPQWTSYSNDTPCTTSTPTTNIKLFNCYLNPAGYSATSYSTFKSTVKAALAANPSAYQTAAQLQTYLQGLLTPGNSADGANAAPTYTDNRSHHWKVSVATDASTTDGCTPSTGTPSTTNTPIATPTGDPFFANTAGNSAVTVRTATACLTASITLQIGTCNVALVVGVCVNVGNYVWGNGTALLGGGQSVPQFKLTATDQTTTTTTVNTASSSTFPSMADVTQYNLGKNGTFDTSGPGDLYVEGTSTRSIALIGQNDVIVTGNLTTSDPNNMALETIALNDTRIYHPVKCYDTNAGAIAATDPAFCPNDMTGLYSTVLPTGNRPDQQYTNLRPDLANLTVHGVLFSLGIPETSINCPQPPQGGGVCGGEFTVDNYERGDSVGATPLGTLLIVGTLAMAHHGPTGEEWEISDTVGQTSRPYSGYQLGVKYQNVKNAVVQLNQDGGVSGLQTTSTTSSLWHVVSVSTGKAS